MERKFCDVCGKEIKNPLENYKIVIGSSGLFSKKITNATICFECADRTREYLRSIRSAKQ